MRSSAINFKWDLAQIYCPCPWVKTTDLQLGHWRTWTCLTTSAWFLWNIYNLLSDFCCTLTPPSLQILPVPSRPAVTPAFPPITTPVLPSPTYTPISTSSLVLSQTRPFLSTSDCQCATEPSGLLDFCPFCLTLAGIPFSSKTTWCWSLLVGWVQVKLNILLYLPGSESGSPICFPCTFVFWLKETDRNHQFKVWRSKGSVTPNVYFLPPKQPSVSPIL